MQRIDQVKPFLRWVGGKQVLLSKLLECVNAAGKIVRYFEPFLGGGTLFFAREYPLAYLSDDNEWLIHAYKAVRDSPICVYEMLIEHRRLLHAEQRPYFLEVRKAYNDSISSRTFDLDQAVRFIFLNRSSFKGIYRVNRSGFYNVNLGPTCNPYIPSEENLLQASERLKRAELTSGDFAQQLEHVRVGDFVYLDPPYPKLSKTANFNQYTIDPFSEQQQRELAELAHELKQRGAKVMVSNAGVPLIEELFQHGWQIHNTEISRRVSSKAPQMYAKELIITSFKS